MELASDAGAFTVTCANHFGREHSDALAVSRECAQEVVDGSGDLLEVRVRHRGVGHTGLEVTGPDTHGGSLEVANRPQCHSHEYQVHE